ncbi:hypothetical protein QTI66_21210 [Variovorax sp. J22R133]|uniref:hypothetical protein n=1 Tax=Variovorax brevis TaxID=3053503 RepID=UPI002578DED9|nr:hypothetical protein [Variovorax sp. J22R133]MDM0114685.1 hypothetical protein [Variovorax sp. J22R133]
MTARIGAEVEDWSLESRQARELVAPSRIRALHSSTPRLREVRRRKMIQKTPAILDSSKAWTTATKRAAKSALRRVLGGIARRPLPKKLLMNAIKWIPPLDRRVQLSMQSFEESAVDAVTGPEALSPSAMVVYRRLQQYASQADAEGSHARRH